MLGLFTGFLFWWSAGKLRRFIPYLIEPLRSSSIILQRSLSANVEESYRREITRQAQQSHLASPLFNLEEILVPPLILAPPIPIQPGSEYDAYDIVSSTLPYLPDWPELGAIYGWQTLSIPDTLQGGANLALIGRPGGGKSVSLSYLSWLLARRDPLLKDLSTYFPILVHAADITVTNQEPVSIDILNKAITYRFNSIKPVQLAGLISYAFEKEQVFLLIDGLDELVPTDVNQIVVFLKTILKQYSSTRVVVATSPEYLDGLTSLGFIPVAMTAWNMQAQSTFLDHWIRSWEHFIQPDRRNNEEGIDSTVLKSWILGGQLSTSPFDFIMKVWGAMAGDALGPAHRDSIEAYVRRMLSITSSEPEANVRKARLALEQVALQIVFSMTTAITQRVAERGVVQEEEPEPFIILTGDNEWEAEQGSQGTGPKEKKRKSFKKSVLPTQDIQKMLPALLKCGLLTIRSGDKIAFTHPILASYLVSTASKGLSSLDSIARQPRWMGRTISLEYLSACDDMTAIIEELIDSDNDPLSRGVLTAGRWLGQVPGDAPWRSLLMRHLAMITQNDSMPFAMRTRALLGLAGSGDPGIPALFRQWLTSASFELRLLAALGCGMVKDVKAVDDLAQQLINPIQRVCKTACLALAAIGNNQAIEILRELLLTGNEDLRRAAAEALANHPHQGHSTLQECIQMDDLLVRRAAIFGLKRVDEDWALKTLEKIQIEDQEWVVRTLATQALDEIQDRDNRVPRPFPPLAQTPWLIAFAGRLGFGVTPGKPALELLIRSFREGDDEHKLAAMARLGRLGESAVLPELFHLLKSENGELREAAYNTLIQLSSTGVDFPSQSRVRPASLIP